MSKSKNPLIFCLLFLLGQIKGNDALMAQPIRSIPSQAQLAWQNAELGVVFHYDLHVFDNKQYSQTQNRVTPVADYNIFNPGSLNTDQWIRSAKAAGARFAIMTVTHETGFALYQSDVNPYCLKAIKWRDGKGDIVRDFVNSCRKYGLKPGLYVGIRWNSFFGVHDFKVEGGSSRFTANRQSYYNKMIEGMVKELCTRYGPLFEIWFDGGAADPNAGTPDILPIVEKYQPGCLFYWNSQRADARWGGSESGTVGYPCWATFPYASTDAQKYPQITEKGNDLLKHGNPDGRYWMPAMADAPLRGYDGRHEWFWEPGDTGHIWPVENLVDMYYKSVGRNATLILGLTPDPSGLIPKPDSIRLSAFGEEIHRRFDKPVLSRSGAGRAIVLRMSTATEVNQLVLQEDISQGESIRQYQLLAKVGDKWKRVCNGSSVGHKRIQVFAPVTAKVFKLEISKAHGMPKVQNIALYSVRDSLIRN